MAKNEIGLSDPLESEEPVHVLRPPGIRFLYDHLQFTKL